MKQSIALLFACLLFLFASASCRNPYPEQSIIGKTSAEIVAEFGNFDCILAPESADGLYRNGACGYTLEPSRVGFLGTSPEILLFISFDRNGIAVSCKEGYRPGG